MPALQRSVSLRGPMFYKDDGKLLFVNQIDASTREGPREATEDDMAAHPGAWERYEAAIPREPITPLIRPSSPAPEEPPAPQEGPHARRRREAAEA